MNATLSCFANVPVTTAAVASMYPALRAGTAKANALEASGTLIRLRRGLYVVSPETSGKPLSVGLMANHIYAPSYLSRLSALRLYGLTPETVYTTQSMTVRQARTFVNSVGRFEYARMSRAAFHVGLRMRREEGVSYLIASPEKALCDLMATISGVNLRYKTEARRFLEEDLRLDMEAAAGFDISVFEAYIAAGGKKPTTIRTIINLLKP